MAPPPRDVPKGPCVAKGNESLPEDLETPNEAQAVLSIRRPPTRRLTNIRRAALCGV